MQIIKEQKAIIKATLPERDPSKKQEVFYNPLMTSNRNISILLLNSVANKDMDIADPLAGSGIRAIRFLQELTKGKIKQLFINDNKEHFAEVLTENLHLSNISAADIKHKLVVRNDDAEHFLLSSPEDNFNGYFDYIDIDPFGTPNPFLSAAVNRIKRDGILAITATDTAALTGTYPKVTLRKYWARNVRTYLMHEIGLRILIRKIQLQGIQFDKVLVPILAYHKDHYFRMYFRSEKGKEKCDAILKQHQYFLMNPKTLEFKTSVYNFEEGWEWMGPLWVGPLFDWPLLEAMNKKNTFQEEEKFLSLLLEEAAQDQPFFYDLRVLAKKYGKEPPKMDVTIQQLAGTRTHFSGTGIKTKKPLKEVLKVLR